MSIEFLYQGNLLFSHSFNKLSFGELAEWSPPGADPPLVENAPVNLLYSIEFFVFKMAITYILRSTTTKKFYIGSSHFDNPDKRLKDHNGSRVKYTKPGRPWALIHCEKFKTYTEARKRENFLKSGVGRQWIYDNFRNKK